MGSPLSPALCLMVVSISEQIWTNCYRSVLTNHHLFIRHIRYVDNRLILGDRRYTAMDGVESWANISVPLPPAVPRGPR